MRKFAISDIHGCCKTFKLLLKEIDFQPSDRLYLLGDFINRGADSKGLFDYIFRLQDLGYFVKCLRGNHEAMLLSALGDPAAAEDWAKDMGKATLQSFGVEDVFSIPERYITFIKNMEYYIEVDQYILLHAGLNFKTSAPLKDKYNQLWIRNWYENVNYDWLKSRLVIHGHAATHKSDIEQLFSDFNVDQYLNIDAGCTHSTPDDPRHLCAYEMITGELFFVENAEDEKKDNENPKSRRG